MPFHKASVGTDPGSRPAPQTPNHHYGRTLIWAFHLLLGREELCRCLEYRLSLGCLLPPTLSTMPAGTYEESKVLGE